jgi:tetrahydromethanopterin S-methyltransferase subunit G
MNSTRRQQLPTIEEDICEGVRIEEEIADLKARLEEIKQRIRVVAEHERGQRSSVRIVRSVGVALVKYVRDITLDDAVILRLKDALPADVFGGVFTSHTTFRLAEGWQDKLAEGKVSRFKARIADAIKVTDRTPSVKFTAVEKK